MADADDVVCLDGRRSLRQTARTVARRTSHRFKRWMFCRRQNRPATRNTEKLSGLRSAASRAWQACSALNARLS
eukprot:239306-Chlamydomonas_euryale.AAC.1